MSFGQSTGIEDDAPDLLEQFGLNEPTETFDEDPIVYTPSGYEAPEAAPKPETVPKADHDALLARIDAMQRQIGEMAAQRLAPSAPAAPQYQQPQPQYQQPDFTRLDQEFFQSPSLAAAQIAQRVAADSEQRTRAAQMDTEALVAQQIIATMRSKLQVQDPDLAAHALPHLDKLVAETPPAQLAQLLRTGRLQSDYEGEYHRLVGKALVPVYAKARARKATAPVAAPPAIGGGTVNARASVTPLRKSDLSESEREAIEQGRKLGIDPKYILQNRDSA